MITLPDRIKNDLSGNLTSAEYLVAIKTDPVIYISTTKQMFDATEGDVYVGQMARNGQFSNDLDWDAVNSADIIIENNSATIVIDSGVSYGGIAQTEVGLIEGEKYKLEFEVTNVNAVGSDPTITLYNYSAGGQTTIYTSNVQNGVYTDYFIGGQSGSFADKIDIRIQVQDSSGGSSITIKNLKLQSISPVYYEDIDLKLSNIKEKIDLKTKKIQLSSMSLTFSNFPINEVRLSDKLGNGLGKEISVYLKTASCETLEDCIKVADLKINRYNHDRNTVKISADDKWLESFYIDLPRTLLEKDKNTFENYHLKPVPILYGHLENAPALPYYEETEGYSFIEDGIKILPDSSYLGGSSEIQGIKQWNEYDSGGNLRSLEQMEDPNVFKIKLSDTTLASITVRPYVNTRQDIRGLHNYSQYETHDEYLLIKTLTQRETDDASHNSNLVGMWCSYESKLINRHLSSYISADGTNNSYGGNYHRSPNSVVQETGQIYYLTSGRIETLGTAPDTLDFRVHNFSIDDYEFESLTGVDVYADDITGEDVISDVQFLGDGVFGYFFYMPNAFGVYDYFDHLKMFNIYSPYKYDPSFDGLDNFDRQIATPTVWDFEWGTPYFVFPDNVNTLRDNSRNKYQIKGLSQDGGGISFENQVPRYINRLGAYFNQGGDYNTFESTYDNGAAGEYPTINANNVAMYYTLGYEGIDNPNTGGADNWNASVSVDLQTNWENVKLRKYWKNKDIFLKDLFVNAKGRVGNELVGAKSINAEIKVWYEGEDAPDPSADFTMFQNKHLSELYKFLTDNKYKTKSINGEIYELMLYSQNLADEDVFMFDIDVNNFYASNDMITAFHNEDYPVIYINNEAANNFTINSSHNLGWLFEITAKTFGNHYNFENDIMWMGGLSLVYGKKNIVNGVLEGITPATHDSLESFNLSNGSYNNSVFTGYSWIKWDSSLAEENPKELLEQPEDIISNLVTTEMNAGGVQMPDQTYSKFGFSINEQENSKDIIENICRQSELFFRYSPRDGQAIIDKIKTQYAQADKTIESDRILKYSFNKTKIDDLCFGGCRVKWGWDYGKEEAIGITEDAIVIDVFMEKYLTAYGVEESDENDIQTFKESGKYQLEVEAPYINNEATAIKFRDFLFQFYKNTHLTLKLTLALQDGIELEVGDIVAFDKDIGLKPYGNSIVIPSSLPSNNGDQIAYPYFLITSVSKSLSKVDIEVMQMHDLLGTAIFSGCTIEGYENYDPINNVDDGSCNYIEVFGCTIEGSQNYDPLATTNDGSCIPPDPLAPVAHYNLYFIDEVSLPQTQPYAGYQFLFVSDSYDDDGHIVSHQWELAVFDDMNVIETPSSLQNDLNLANDINHTNLVLNTTYDHIGLVFLVMLTVTDNDEMTSYYNAPAMIYVLDPELEITGDINNDYSVDVLDVIALVSHILENEPLLGVGLQQADLTGDGIIDVLDLVAMINVILGDS